MKYEINDQTMVDEICGLDEIIRQEIDKIKLKCPDMPLDSVEHPLDDDVIGSNGLLKKLTIDDNTITYSSIDQLDKIWCGLLEKAIVCLRFFDRREPFLKNSQKTIVAYGLDKLVDYHDRYTDFESLMYGASSYYRDHVFHAVRVWYLGIFCLIKPIPKDEQNNNGAFIDQLALDGGAELPGEINFFEKISMWTIIALCHDLGYPLEKADQILDKTRKMMKEFIPSPNIWNNFGYSGVQDNINEYILKFISTKMKKADSVPEEPDDVLYFGRIQPKYYLKYAKSLEHFQHGIISAVIIYKMLLYFLESDFNLNDDYTYKKEDARQFYIRREILRAIASHTCPDAYNIHLTTFSSLLFLCDELQEWGRKSWNELYTGISDTSVSLVMDYFEPEGVNVSETITLKDVKDNQIVVENIIRVFKRQYSLYKTTFRDGQYTATRDFDLLKSMNFILPSKGATKRNIVVNFCLPSSGESSFTVNLSQVTKDDKKDFEESLKKNINNLLYGSDLKIETTS